MQLNIIGVGNRRFISAFTDYRAEAITIRAVFVDVVCRRGIEVVRRIDVVYRQSSILNSADYAAYRVPDLFVCGNALFIDFELVRREAPYRPEVVGKRQL